MTSGPLGTDCHRATVRVVCPADLHSLVRVSALCLSSVGSRRDPWLGVRTSQPDVKQRSQTRAHRPASTTTPTLPLQPPGQHPSLPGRPLDRRIRAPLSLSPSPASSPSRMRRSSGSLPLSRRMACLAAAVCMLAILALSHTTTTPVHADNMYASALTMQVSSQPSEDATRCAERISDVSRRCRARERGAGHAICV
jgi:hypothetical protein